MAWIRLSDDYNDHPKFDHLTDGAFRLWHQGMGFCRKYQTDGLIPTASLRQFKAYSTKRARILMTAWTDGENPLWHAIDGFGVRVHDYLEWNPSKEAENERRQDSKDRMRALRGAKPSTVSAVRALSVSTNNSHTTRDVPDQGMEERAFKKETSRMPPMNGTTDPELAARAGDFCERYAELYFKHRRGARYLPRPALDYTKACELCAVWDNDRLERLAVVFLKCEEPFAMSGSRTIGQFAAMASWADDRLREAEAS